MNALGRHLLVELYEGDPEILDDVGAIERLMTEAAEVADATVIHTAFHHFSPKGVSGVVVVQESHLAIHTWPEWGFAAIDLFTCGEQMAPWRACDYLQAHLKAGRRSTMEIDRGAEISTPLSPASRHLDIREMQRDLWFTQRNETLAFSLKHYGDRPFRSPAGLQKIEIYDTLAFGRMLSLNGKIALAEQDEYIYHEMMVHVPMQVLFDPQQVLIIGGGDGAAAREALRYAGVAHVRVIEQDARVPEVARLHLSRLAVPWEDPRLVMETGEGRAFLSVCEEESWDLLVLDAVLQPGSDLQMQLFREAFRVLKPGGVLIAQSGAPRLEQAAFQKILHDCRAVFGQEQVSCYLSYVPTYPTGTWSFAFCSKGRVHPLRDFQEEKARLFAVEKGLRYYNEAVHRAAFALPNDLRSLMH
jgi:spermidine synthase